MFNHQPSLRVEPKILTSDGFVKAKDAVIGFYYTQSSLINDILPSIELTNLISEEYADKDLSKWAIFFQKLGVVPLSTEVEIIEYKVKYLLERQGEIHIAENSLAIVSELVALYKEDKLSNEIGNLNELSLLLKKNEVEFSEANRCHLSTEYGPKLDLETLLSGDTKSEIDFVSEKYLSGKENKVNVSKFFREIGIANDFKIIESFSGKRKDLNPAYRNFIDAKNNNIRVNAQSNSINHRIEPWLYLNYTDFLDNYQVALRFWEKVLKEDKYFREKLLKDATYKFSNNSVRVLNYTVFRLRTEPVVPTISRHCAKTTELYSTQFKDVIQDQSLLPAIDLTKCEVENESLEAWLGINQQLSLKLCLDCIQWKQDFAFLKKNRIWERIETILQSNGVERLDSENKVALSNFKEIGYLPNQLNEWKPIEELYFIENFEIGIGNSPHLVNNKLAFLAEAMGLKKLVESDFKPDFIEANRSEFTLEKTLRDRVKYIAYAENQNDWKERETEYWRILSHYQFYQTSRIVFCYAEVNPPIEKTDLKFYQQENKIYFVGDWRGARAAKLFDFVCEKLVLEKVISESLMDLLLNTEPEILDSFEDKQLSIPAEWEPSKPPVTPPVSTQQTKTEIKYSDDGPELTPDEGKVVTDKALTGGLNPDEQKKANVEAKRVAKEWLEKEDYDCSMEDGEFDQLQNVHYPGNDSPFTVYVSSVKRGFLYLRPLKWAVLDEPNSFLLVVGPGRTVTRFDSTIEILEKYKRTLMRVTNSVLTQQMVDSVANASLGIESMQFIFYNEVAHFDEELDAFTGFKSSNDSFLDPNEYKLNDSVED